MDPFEFNPFAFNPFDDTLALENEGNIWGVQNPSMEFGHEGDYWIFQEALNEAIPPAPFFEPFEPFEPLQPQDLPPPPPPQDLQPLTLPPMPPSPIRIYRGTPVKMIDFKVREPPKEKLRQLALDSFFGSQKCVCVDLTK